MQSADTLGRDARFTVIDFETTGSVRGFPNEPWQIGMVEFADGKVQAARLFESLLRVGGDRPFNPRAPGRHAERRQEIAVAPTLAEIWTEVSPWLVGRPLVAHNVGTERTVLARAAPLHRLGPWVDTLKLVRRAYPSLPNHSLECVVDALGLRQQLDEMVPGREAHDALYDAYASGVVLAHLLSLPGWCDTTVEDLTSC